MGDKFYPDRFLKQVMPKSFYSQNLVDKDFDLKKNALKAINRTRTITGRPIDTTVYNVLSQYEQKYKGLIADGESSTQAFNEAVNNSALLRQRIEQAVVYDEIQNLKTQHAGEFYRWLPSSAANPDPEHQLLYGKIFRVGEGDKNGNMPGERYGCQCGIEWLDSGENARERILRGMDSKFVKSATNLYQAAMIKQHQNYNPIPFNGVVKGREARKIKNISQEDVKNLRHTIVPNGARHMYRNHGNEIIERSRPHTQTAVTEKDVALIPYIVANYDKVSLSPQRTYYENLKALIYKKRIGNRIYFYVEAIDNRNKKNVVKMLKTQTMYIHIYP